MTAFFSAQFDYICFFYGLSFIMLAAICFVLPKSSHRLLPWSLLGSFGLLHGAHEWLALLSITFASTPLFTIVRMGLLALSFLLLLEFARCGLNTYRTRPITRWVYLPLIGGVLLGGAAGYPVAYSLMRYLLAFPAGLASALAFYLAGRQMAPGAGLPWRLAVVTFGCYAVVAGLVVESPTLFASSVLNAPAFAQWTGGIPIQLVRGLLAVMMTLCIWRFTQSARTQTHLLSSRPARNPQMSLMVVTLIALFVGGWITTDLMGREAAKTLQQRGAADAAFTARILAEALNETEHAVTVLASLPFVRSTLQASSANDRQRLDTVLDQFSTSFDDSVCYIMDRSGTVIASSNRQTPTSFVGQCYQFRPYFQAAMTGRLGTYFAVGATSNARGYYAAYPITDARRQIIGVAVMKKNMERMESILHGTDALYLVDPHGIIFFTNQPTRRFASLWPVPEATRQRIVDAKQFGRHDTFPPLFQQEILDRAQFPIDGDEVSAARKPMGAQGWSVVLFTPLRLVHLYRLFGISISFVLILLAIGAFMIWQIIKESSSRITASELLHRTLINGSPNMVWLCDDHARCLMINPAGAQALEMSREELVGKDFVGIWHEESRPAVAAGVRQALAGELATFEAERRQQHGRTAVYLVVLNPLDDGEGLVQRFVGICTEITERKRAEELAQRNAQYDPLTDLPNRLLFHDLLAASLNNAHRNGKRLAVLYLDIDHFKQVNDTYGHAVGDAVLQAVAQRLESTLRGQDIVSRRGGDEFTILLPEIKQSSDADRVCEKILAAFAAPLDLDGQLVHVTPSIGIALYPSDGDDADTLLINADAALYDVKAHGRNGYRCYQPEDLPTATPR